ncbi:unnamed protein product [Closterium sp. NIES-54]
MLHGCCMRINSHRHRYQLFPSPSSSPLSPTSKAAPPLSHSLLLLSPSLPFPHVRASPVLSQALVAPKLAVSLSDSLVPSSSALPPIRAGSIQGGLLAQRPQSAAGGAEGAPCSAGLAALPRHHRDPGEGHVGACEGRVRGVCEASEPGERRVMVVGAHEYTDPQNLEG